MATMVGTVAPTAAAAQPAACVWTPATLPLRAGALTGEVVAADGSGGYAGTISYGADSEQGGRAVLWKKRKGHRLRQPGRSRIPGLGHRRRGELRRDGRRNRLPGGRRTSQRHPIAQRQDGATARTARRRRLEGGRHQRPRGYRRRRRDDSR